jgi:hypothetical protein
MGRILADRGEDAMVVSLLVDWMKLMALVLMSALKVCGGSKWGKGVKI